MHVGSNGMLGAHSDERMMLSTSSLDHPVHTQQQRRRDGKTERLRRLQVDDQLELGGLLHGKIGRPRALEKLVDVMSGPPEYVCQIGRVSHEAPSVCVSTETIHGWQPVLRGKLG